MSAINQARQYWAERNPREKRALQCWLAAVLLATLYFGVYAPVTSQIQRLEAAVPRLESQLMMMRASKGEMTVLKPGQNQQDLRSATFAALAAKKISADVRSITPKQVELRASTQNVNEALQLAASLRSELAAKVASIQIKQDSAEVALVLLLERQ